jgi:hypothetical protein
VSFKQALPNRNRPTRRRLLPSTVPFAPPKSPSPAIYSTLTQAGILFLATILGTLAASTHLSSGASTCTLRTQWQTLFRSKNEGAIQTIQNILECCGFANIRDMPFPFPSNMNTPETCSQRYSRTASCQAAWSGRLSVTVGGMFAVDVVVGLSAVFAILVNLGWRASGDTVTVPAYSRNGYRDSEDHGVDSSPRAIENHQEEDYAPA